jgi:hypothetical protein
VGAMDAGDYGKVNDYLPYSFFIHINSFIRGRGKWFVHAKDLLNVKQLMHLLVGIVVVLLCGTIFTKKKWAQAVDMNHGLNLGGIEVVRAMEGRGKNGQGLVWSSIRIKEVHRAVEEVMMKEMDFTIINVRHNDTWIDGVEIDAKKLLIYLVSHYGLSEKARTVGIEVSITVDSAKLDDSCCHTTAGWKFTDVSTRDPLIFDNNDPEKRLKLLVETMQSEWCCLPIITMIAKYNKATYDKLLRHIFVFCQEIRDNGIPELGWLPLRVAEPQDVKISQLCMGRGGAAK